MIKYVLLYLNFPYKQQVKLHEKSCTKKVAWKKFFWKKNNNKKSCIKNNNEKSYMRHKSWYNTKYKYNTEKVQLGEWRYINRFYLGRLKHPQTAVQFCSGLHSYNEKKIQGFYEHIFYCNCDIMFIAFYICESFCYQVEQLVALFWSSDIWNFLCISTMALPASIGELCYGSCQSFSVIKSLLVSFIR